MPITLVEGWTGPIQMTIKNDGVETDVDGATLAMRMWNNEHAEVLESGALVAVIAVSGLLQYDPEAVDFLEALSPYYIRIQVTDAVGDVTFYPSGDPDVWTVRGVGP